MPQTDAAAVALARGGDSEAFRALVERHGRAVYRLAYRMTGSAQDAEDVVQETFLKAYRQLTRFESRANFGTWLHRIAVNCSIDLIRARPHREAAHDVPDLEQFGADMERNDADDVVQETFLKAYKQLSRFESRANFGTWLHRIAVNCSIDLIRSRPHRENGVVALVASVSA